MYTEKFILDQYKILQDSWKNNLENSGVTLSTLKKTDGSYTLNALVLIYLFTNFKRAVSKEEITAFLANLGYPVNDMQQARHLSAQQGWYIISGQRGDAECSKYSVKPGEYMLLSITEPYPHFISNRRNEALKNDSWEDLKMHYNNRCVSCGSEEGKNNLLYPNSITKLEQGHKDPGKPLSMDNIIPQCQFCNGASQNYFVFDNRGKVVKIYNPLFILRSDNDIKNEMLKLLMDEDLEKAERLLNDLKSK